MLERFDAVQAVMLPTLGEERRATYSPFLPISPVSGKVLQVPTLERDVAKGTIVFDDPDGGRTELPVTGGHVKIQWRPDWAVRWTALADVNIASALQVTLEREDRVVAGTDALPLIVEGRRNGQRFVALNFDPRRSDLVLRVAWPLFLLNTIDWFVQEDARYVSSYYTGETWHIPVPAGATQATLMGPDQREYVVPVAEGRALFAGTHAGIYTIRTEGADGVSSASTWAVATSRTSTKPKARAMMAG